MSTRKILIIVLLLFCSGIFSSSSNAAEEESILKCNDCGSFRIKKAAMDYGLATNTDGMYVFVADFNNKKLYKFFVRTYTFGGVTDVVAVKETISSYELDVFSDALLFMERTRGGVEIPSTVVDSAYGLFGNAEAMNQISSYITSDLSSFLTYGMNKFMSAFVEASEFKIQVTFSDGTTAEIIISDNLNTSVTEFHLVPDSVKTPTGMLFPDPNGDNEFWQGSTPEGTNLATWLYYASVYGISVVYVDGNSGGNMTCTKGSDGKVTCVITQQR